MPPNRPLTMRNSLLLVALFVGSPAAQRTAQAQDAPVKVHAELSVEQQRLSNGGPDWNESVFKLFGGRAARQRAELSWTRSDRFNLHDEQLGAAYVHPLGDALTLALEITLSPTRQFLPSHSEGALLQYEFSPSWLIHAGWKSRQYTDTTVQQQTLMLEHYLASFSWALAWRPVQALGSQSSSTELRASYYYGDKNSLGFSLSAGQEATPSGGAAIQMVDVQSLALSGRHQLNAAWALNYVASSTRQGNFYVRNGLLLGVQYLF